MPDQEDRLSAALHDYYRRIAHAPVPDLTGRVMTVVEGGGRRRAWGYLGEGAVALAAVAVVIALAVAVHRPPGVSPAHPSPSPSAAPSASVVPSPTASPVHPTPPAVAVPVGPAVHDFLATDVTAVSADEWWVLGYNGPACSSAGCTRVLHTADGGHTFASIPVPPVAPADFGKPANRLRFADPSDGWLVSSRGEVWATHDGGADWTQDSGAGSVADLEASAGTVYAITCAAGPACSLERSPTAQDSWSVLAPSQQHGALSRLNVNGVHIWADLGDENGTTLLTSPDGGATFHTQSVCPETLGISSLYAVNTEVLWAWCATGTEGAPFRSVDGGQHFVQIQGPGMAPNSASIAGTSSSGLVVGGQALFHSADGGQTFASVEQNGTQWSVVGFTTGSDGFALARQSPSGFALWRTIDAGAHWSRVQLP